MGKILLLHYIRMNVRAASTSESLPGMVLQQEALSLLSGPIPLEVGPLQHPKIHLLQPKGDFGFLLCKQHHEKPRPTLT